MGYSFAQLEGLWIQAGGSRGLAPVMAAIALAESGGNPGALNPNDSNGQGGTQSSYGLWQISNGTHSPPSASWSNPLVNARLALAKFHSQGLGAWGTYTSGKYRAFLGSAKPGTPPTGTGQAPGTTTAGGRGSGGTSGSPSAPNAPGTPPATKYGPAGAAAGESWVTSVGEAVDAAGTDIGGVFTLPFQAGLDVASAVEGLTLPFVKFARAIDWFFVPSHWIRIAAGVGGIGFTAVGAWNLGHAGGQASKISELGVTVPLSAGGNMALALGILEVGIGGVLLFIAFHNLDPSVKTVGDLLAYVQGKAQTAASASVSPAVAGTVAAGTGD